MKVCPKCGRQENDSVKFCGGCGTALESSGLKMSMGFSAANDFDSEPQRTAMPQQPVMQQPVMQQQPVTPPVAPQPGVTPNPVPRPATENMYTPPSPSPMHTTPKKKGGAGKAVLIIVVVLVALAAVAYGAGFVYNQFIAEDKILTALYPWMEDDADSEDEEAAEETSADEDTVTEDKKSASTETKKSGSSSSKSSSSKSSSSKKSSAGCSDIDDLADNFAKLYYDKDNMESLIKKTICSGEIEEYGMDTLLSSQTNYIEQTNEKKYGVGYTVTATVVSEEDVADSVFEAYQRTYDGMGHELEEAKDVELRMEFSGDEDEATEMFTVTAVKLDGKWYFMVGL